MPPAHVLTTKIVRMIKIIGIITCIRKMIQFLNVFQNFFWNIAKIWFVVREPPLRSGVVSYESTAIQFISLGLKIVVVYT